MTINLTDAQKAIVNMDEGPILVKAGPGSGKTRVLIERVKRLLRTQPMTKILALTFSNMAAEQMRSRIQEDQDIEDLSDNVTIGTIHSFCLDVVQSRGYLIGLPENLVLFENLADRKRILAEAFRSDTMLFESYRTNKNQDKYLANCLAMISDYKRNFISPTDPELTDENARIYAAYWQKYATQIPSEQRTLLSFRNHVALGKTQLVDSESGVTLLTAHMSKGLQYEVVFVIGLTEGTFPDYRAVQSGGKELEQEQNNMYVAVTRAKRLCYLSSPLYKLMPWGDLKRQRPSRFVLSLIS